MNRQELKREEKPRATLNYDAVTGVFDLDPSVLSDDFRDAVVRCIAAQKEAAGAAFSAFKPNSGALAEVSEEALARLLVRGKDVHGIAKQRSISDVIVFSARNILDSLRSATVEALRARVDKKAFKLVKSIFPGTSRLVVSGSGHFWYPSGSYMGWHTNSGVPGWRVYINYAEEEGKSFFRYRDSMTSEITTLMDKEWNMRIFRITSENPLWHAVYSGTNRFSLGYIIYRESLVSWFVRKLKRLFH
ncbi:MAG TPA: hypothetical protein VN604_03560 [Nitrospirota bacterium]|nr:hypothetical protein [Nitrospirota bacterium]